MSRPHWPRDRRDDRRQPSRITIAMTPAAAAALHPDITPPAVPPASGTRRARAWAWLAQSNPLLLGIAGIGFSVSFQTISALAVLHGLPGWPELYPIGIDVGILAMAVEAARALRDGRSDLVPRIAAWVLAGLTIYVNAHGARSSDWTGVALHVVMPSLWIVCLELSRWRTVRRVRHARGEDKIPLARWLLDWRTFGMRRRMVLSRTGSYAVACAREDVRRAARSLLPAVWGKDWRAAAPALLRWQVRTGSLTGDVAAACARAAEPGFVLDAGHLAEQMVVSASVTRTRAQAAVRRAQVQERGQAPAPNSPAPARHRAPPAAPGTPPARSRTTPDAPGRPMTPQRAAARQAWLDAPPGTSVQDLIDQTGLSRRTVQRARIMLSQELSADAADAGMLQSVGS